MICGRAALFSKGKSKGEPCGTFEKSTYSVVRKSFKNPTSTVCPS
jgi:hypothetical protein